MLNYIKYDAKRKHINLFNDVIYLVHIHDIISFSLLVERKYEKYVIKKKPTKKTQ